MAIAEGIVATKATLEVAKLVMDKLNTPNFDVHDIRLKVQEMLIHVVNAQAALGEAQIEISELRHKLENRDDLKVLAADIEHVQGGGYIIRKSERERSILNPCCPICWGQDKKVIPLAPMANGYYKCALHRTSYRSAETIEFYDNNRHTSF